MSDNLNARAIALSEALGVAMRTLQDATELLDWLSGHIEQIRRESKQLDLGQIDMYHRHVEMLVEVANSHMRLAGHTGRNR